MPGQIILSNRHRALLDSMENFGNSIQGIRKAQKDDEERKIRMHREQSAADMGDMQLADFKGQQAAKTEAQGLATQLNDFGTAVPDSTITPPEGLAGFTPMQSPRPATDTTGESLKDRLRASMHNAGLRAEGKSGGFVTQDDIRSMRESKTQEKLVADTDQKVKLGELKVKERQVAVDEKKLDAELKRITAGGMDPEKAVAVEGTLRNQFVDINKPFMIVRDAWSRVQAADDSGAGDVSMIYSLMKILDPGASVMEGDIANARNTAGIPEKVRIAYNNAIEGRSLDPKQRQQFRSQAGSLFDAQKKIYTSNAKTFSNLALDYGVNPGRVVIDLGGDVASPGGAGPAPTSTARPAASPPASGGSKIGRFQVEID